MKKKDDKTNKIVFILNCFTAICYFLVAIINFVNSSSIGILYLCLGCTFLCLGTVYLNKDKKEEE